MAASSSIGSSGQGLYAIVLGAIEDEVSLDTCEDPVSLNPCGHLFSQETAEELLTAGQPCATCRTPITSYARSDQVSRIAQAVLAYQASEEPAYSPESWQLCKKGGKLLSRGLHAPALELFLSAQEIDPFSLAVQTCLELAVQFAFIEKESRSTEETTESYLGVLCKLAAHPEISQDPVLGLIIEQQIEEMIHIQDPNLTVVMRESADLFRRLISDDNIMSISVSKRIKERYASRDNKRAAAAAASSDGGGITSSKATAGPANRQPSPTSYTKTSRKYGEAQGFSSRAVGAAASAGSASEVDSVDLERDPPLKGRTCWVYADTSSSYPCQFDYSKIPLDELSPIEIAAYQGDLGRVQGLTGDTGARALGFRGTTPLHWAAAGGDVNIIEYLIKKGARVDAYNYDKIAPIHLAALFGHCEAIRALARHGAAVNFEYDPVCKACWELDAPIHFATENGHLEAVQILGALGADPNLSDSTGYCPLHIAASRGHALLIPVLIGLGAKLERRTHASGPTPLFLAAERGESQSVRVLKELGANIYQGAYFCPEETPLMAAVRNGDPETIRLLFSSGNTKRSEMTTDVSILEFAPIHLVAGRGEIGKLELLLELGEAIDLPDHRGATPLSYAILKEQVEAVIDLVRRGAHLYIRDDNGNFPIRQIAHLSSHSREIYRALWESRADRNIRKDFGKLPVKCAFMTPWGKESSSDELRLDEGEAIDIDLMLELVGLGASEEARRQQENTPLHYAACCQRLGPEMIRTRLRIRPEELNAQNRNGETPLHRAVNGGLIENVRSLFYFGADLNSPDREGQTPLYYAVRSGDLEVLRELIQAGAHVYPIDGKGNAPIHYAALASRNGREMLFELRRAGSEVNIPNYEGKTPLDLAIENSVNLIELIKLGADVGRIDEEGNTLVHRLTSLHELSTFVEVIDITRQMNVPNSKGETPLHLAVRSWRKTNVPFLMVRAAHLPNHLGQTPLHYALHYAVESGEDNVPFLMGLRAAHLPNHLGQTPLHYAVESGEIDVVCEFLRSGVDINSRDAEGNTPLFYAKGIMMLYLERLGADVLVRNNQGDTLLHFRVKRHDLGEDLSKWFYMKNRGEIDAQNNEGDTPLHLAVKGDQGLGTFYHATMLIGRGADRRKPNHQGQTPLDCVKEPALRNDLERVEVQVESSMRGAELEWEKVERKLAELGLLPRSNR